MEENKKAKRENVVAGIVGAFLGSLVGVLCTVIIGQMGYVASISGLVMAVGSLKGYELLGGRLSKKGAVISSVLVLVMTWLAHRLSWAVALMLAVDAGLFDCFRAIPGLLEAGALEGSAYWGDLAMLYLFTLLGAVPTILAGLRNADLPDLPQGRAASAAQDGEAADAVFYPGDSKWMRPLRMSASLAMLVGFVPGIVLIVWCIANNTDPIYSLAALGCIAAAVVMMCAASPGIRLCNYALLLLVWANGTVWKVSLAMLNTQDTYRFTKKIGMFRSLNWDDLNEEERERAKVSVRRAIELLSSGQVMPGSVLSVAVCPLTNLQVVQEDSRKWKCTYSVANGGEKKLSIPKAYPGFVPAPGLEPAQGPVPAQWGLLAAAVVLAAALGLVGAGIGRQLGGTGLSVGKPNPAPTPTPAQAQSEPTADAFDAAAQFHVGTEWGYSYTAVGYIKAPDGMTWYDSYLDVEVPYSENPVYLDGGYTIRSAAHGMEVTVTIANRYEDAAAVVNAAYELFEASGVDIYDASETQYMEEYDIAVKQVTYFEENRTTVRIAILYADYKQDGYYLNAAIVYQPELMDEVYPELLEELGDAYALNLPEIEPMESDPM